MVCDVLLLYIANQSLKLSTENNTENLLRQGLERMCFTESCNLRTYLRLSEFRHLSPGTGAQMT